MSITHDAPAHAPDPAELRAPEALAVLDGAFGRSLAEADEDLHRRLVSYREGGETLTRLETSKLLLALAPHLERFVASLYGVEKELAALHRRTLDEGLAARFKAEFVQRRTKRYRGEIHESFETLHERLRQRIDEVKPSPDADFELALARFAVALLDDEQANAADIELVTQWCLRALQTPQGRDIVRGWTSFRLPQPVDPAHLVPLEPVSDDDPAGRLQLVPERHRHRDGFALTDPRMSLRQAMDQVHYCIYCHDHDGDFCSRGFPAKKRQPELGLKVNALGVTLTGCPLDEKVSEMHLLKRDGHAIGALAMAMVDNPMVPATGHRICNDCMKGCIYQKQDPVDIPQIETRVLTDVLELPWGVEIYDLLARWNPLRRRQYVQRPFNGRRVLISGLGPAGFTMAHHLTMEGCAVVGIDGLKIEPLPERLLNEPVRDFETLKESLDTRTMMGFGGVAEYGITVRWDKNFLTLIYLTLARRHTFQVFGGVRLGGTITLDNAWELGFDHVCTANGAGLPRVIPMGNSLARGMRQANDFLMALQLTGAAKDDSLANLEVRMPAVVIGGGLTAIDTATEVQAYYIKQVEKVLHRYETLATEGDEEQFLRDLPREQQEILSEFLEHGRAVRAERERAAAAGEEPDLVTLLRSWGGVTIVYRRGLNESPAYLRNHEEIVKAMEEGLYYAPGLEPVRAELDGYGHVHSLVCRKLRHDEGRWLATGHDVEIPARAILVAAGTFPNTIYESEHPGTFELDGTHFMPHVVHKQGVQPVQVANHCKEDEFGPFTSYGNDNRRVSFIGDSHPVFNGSVVKAIASATRSYPEIMHGLEQLPERDADATKLEGLREQMSSLLTARIESVTTEQPAIVEIRVRAPMAARNFRPGQFFRLQTFETTSRVVRGTRLQVPLQTASGAGVDGDCIRLMLLPWGANARIASSLEPGTPVVLMGPTGEPTPIHEGRTVLVIAGTWGAAVMLGLGPALKAAGNRVLYVAAYAGQDQLYCKPELQETADQIIWVTGREPLITADRPQDSVVHGWDVVDVIRSYDDGAIPPSGPGATDRIRLTDVDEVFVMGGTGLLRGVQDALQDGLRSTFRPDTAITGTVGSPMQCMLKGVCSQCLQWQIDPDTGRRTRAVFSCAMQDQPLTWIDLDNLAARQGQNRLQEHLTGHWVRHILEHPGPAEQRGRDGNGRLARRVPR